MEIDKITNEIEALQAKIAELERKKQQEMEKTLIDTNFEPNFAVLNDIFKKHIQTGIVFRPEYHHRQKMAVGTDEFYTMKPTPEDYDIITHKRLNIHTMLNMQEMAEESYQIAEAFLNILKGFNERLTKLEEKSE
jgi:hypothetical protein